MIQNLMTALGAAVLALSAPTSNMEHQEPKRAYYDSSAVAEYETNPLSFTNYSSKVLQIGYVITEENNLTSGNGYSFALESNTSTTYTTSQGGHIKDLNGSNAGGFFCISPYSPQEKLDVYVNGEYYGILEYSYRDSGPFGYIFACSSLISHAGSDSYIWIFDHEEQAPMSQTIIETAGDATTAAATVIGSGISGVITLFYNEGITGLGILALIMAGVSLVWFAFALVIRLWRRR